MAIGKGTREKVVVPTRAGSGGGGGPSGSGVAGSDASSDGGKVWSLSERRARRRGIAREGG